MLHPFNKSLVWLVFFFCWQAQAMDNPRQPIIDLQDQIEQLVMREGPFSAELIEPIMTLAKLHLEDYELESATDQLQRAQNIAHRNEGVYTPRQFEAITLLTEIALNEADYRAANTQQKFAFFVQTHNLDPQDPEILFAYSEMADWYMYTGQTRRARQLLNEGIKKAVDLGIDPLPLAIELSQVRRLEGTCCVSKQLLKLVEGSSAMDHDTLANAYIEIADTYILARKEKLAAEYFLKANEESPLSVSVDPRPISARRLISNLQAQQARIYRVEKDLFNRTNLKRSTHEEMTKDLGVEPQWFIIDEKGAHRGFVMPDSGSNLTESREISKLVGYPIRFSEDQLNNLIPLRLSKRKEELRIALSFTVTRDGNLEEIEVTNSTAPGKLERLVVDALKKTYYRPGLANGVPVTTKNVQLVQTFASHYKGMQ